MQLLTILTLILAAVVVLAVAASLIGILVALWRIVTMLGEVREALATVPGDTAPLEPVLEPLRDMAAQVARDLQSARVSFEHADYRLGELAAGLTSVVR